jgi:membrane protease YdiL (CAAX protease family)
MLVVGPCPNWKAPTPRIRNSEGVSSPVPSSSRGAKPVNPRGRYIIGYPPLLFASWIVAWIINVALRERFHWDVQTDTIYWITMKVIVWVVPALLAIRVEERESLVQFLELTHVGRGVLWGSLIGLALVAVTFLGKALPAGTQAHVPSVSLVLLNAVVVAPLVEEITLRGFFLKRLELNSRSLWSANLLTTLVFVVMHVPGWLFNMTRRSGCLLMVQRNLAIPRFVGSMVSAASRPVSACRRHSRSQTTLRAPATRGADRARLVPQLGTEADSQSRPDHTNDSAACSTDRGAAAELTSALGPVITNQSPVG